MDYQCTNRSSDCTMRWLRSNKEHDKKSLVRHSSMKRRKPTIRDIAKKAGVSDTTVSLCFQENPRISSATKQRVLSVAKEIGYIPNRAARDLRFGTNNLIGIVVPDVTNPFHARMIQLADKIAAENQYRVLFSQSHWDPDTEVSAVRDLISHGVRGLLVFFSEKTRESYDLILRSETPHIAVDTRPEFYDGAYVINDLERSGRIAAEHLLDVGCKRFAFLGGESVPQEYSAAGLLRKGFFGTLIEKNVPQNDLTTIPAGLSIADGEQALSALLERHGRVDGIYCMNDLCAIGAMEASKGRGYHIGTELKIMGIDNLEISALSAISLTSIEEPREEIMRVAVYELISALENQQLPSVHARLDAALVVRASTSG